MLFLYVLVLCAIDATVGTGSGLGLGATGGVCLVAPDVDAMLKKTGPTRAHVLDATLDALLLHLQLILDAMPDRNLSRLTAESVRAT